MVTKSLERKLSIDESDAIEKAMYEKGYLTYEYATSQETLETDVKCPICGDNLILSAYGNSHQIKCKTENCVELNFRGL